MDDDVKGFVGVVIFFVILMAIGITINATIPCQYIGWLSIKDIPARCLLNH